MKFTVYKQYPPTQRYDDSTHTKEWMATITPVGSVLAPSSEAALAAARVMPLFANEPKNRLTAWPIVAPAFDPMKIHGHS